MFIFLTILLIISVSVAIFVYTHKSSFEQCYTGDSFKIPCDLNDFEMAVQILTSIDNNISKFIIQMEEKYMDDEYTSKSRKDAIRRLRNKYKPRTLYETHPFNPEGDTSFTINTGDLISICIRKWDEDANAFVFHDLNTLMYVTFHELAHVASGEINHPERFWRVFKWLLQDAIDMGFYKNVNYRKHPLVYCKKLVLNSNVTFDTVSTFE